MQKKKALARMRIRQIQTGVALCTKLKAATKADDDKQVKSILFYVVALGRMWPAVTASAPASRRSGPPEPVERTC